MTDMYQAQIALEAAALEQGRQRYLAACQTSKGTRKGTKDQPVGHALIRTLVTPVAEALKDSLHNKRGNGRVKAIPETVKAWPVTLIVIIGAIVQNSVIIIVCTEIIVKKEIRIFEN